MTAIRVGAMGLGQEESVHRAEVATVEVGIDIDSLCRQLHPKLVGALRLYLNDLELARELAQDALVRVVERQHEVLRMVDPQAWAYRVAFNLARSRLRRLGAERRATARRGPDPTEAATVDVAAAVAVRRALALLPPRQRQVVVLRVFLDQSVEQAAAAMGCRPGTVKAHLHQAITSLRLAGLADDDDLSTSEEDR